MDGLLLEEPELDDPEELPEEPLLGFLFPLELLLEELPEFLFPPELELLPEEEPPDALPVFPELPVFPLLLPEPDELELPELLEALFSGAEVVVLASYN